MYGDDKVPPGLKPSSGAASFQILRLTRNMLFQTLKESAVRHGNIGVLLQKPAHHGI
jgi:hypothetical protein